MIIRLELLVTNAEEVPGVARVSAPRKLVTRATPGTSSASIGVLFEIRTAFRIYPDFYFLLLKTCSVLKTVQVGYLSFIYRATWLCKPCRIIILNISKCLKGCHFVEAPRRERLKKPDHRGHAQNLFYINHFFNLWRVLLYGHFYTRF